jgi:hypothetical protein
MHGGKEECILSFGGKARMKETTRKACTKGGGGTNIKMGLKEIEREVWTRVTYLWLGTSSELLLA